MDPLRALESLVPGAQFAGTMKDNTQQQYAKVTWLDGRTKPTWAMLVTENGRFAALDAQEVTDLAARSRISKRELERQKVAATAVGDTEAEKVLDDDLARV